MAETARKERKVVTVLFADLVGFTSRAETLDPEDVEAILRPYHERLRAELERHGGTVEKFIGDAVMAVFGAPVAREDDPERAVRAALAIRDWASEEGGGEIRVALATGEALVNLAARPESGEGMVAGDVVNTAARLQTAAPLNGILVGDTTYRATRDVIDYAEAGPVEAKGKSEPITVWRALQARSRLGVDVARFHTTPLVGREHEVSVLSQTLRRALHEHTPQLLTIMGAPGIGKSRLVFELMQVVADAPELIVWRQGRSLPYGEGVSFWSLSEMVKAQAGILDGDSEEDAAAKLTRAVADAVPEEADWVFRHLRPLAGLETEDAAEAQRTERFAAWRRFFESLAERSPVVLVFEDLHWADDGLLDFVDHLAEWVSGVPLLLVGTARPELLERRPAWGGGKLNATTLALAPLSEQETARLVHSLLDVPLIEADRQSALLSRAGGNPLYAEQYARMLSERDDLAELPLPESVQGIIAARVDALPPSEKTLLQDASVLGKIFWSGSVIALQGLESWELEELLHNLERKDFVQRARRSSVAGSSEYSFRHVLVRDVAYGQIPRGDRSDKHRRVGEWLDSLGRPEDLAEMLAHHYLQALDLARAAGRDTDELTEPARRAAREAGDRALALNAPASALRFYRHALQLTPGEAVDRPKLLFHCGKAQFLAEGGGIEVLAEARDALLKVGELETAAEAEITIADIFRRGAEGDRAAEHLERAASLLAEEAPSRSKAYVLGTLSLLRALAGKTGDAVRDGKEALRLAEELELVDLQALALNNIGVARCQRGDFEGLADLERSVILAEEIRDPWHAVRGYANLAGMLGAQGELRRSAGLHDKALELSKRFGVGIGTRWMPGEQAWDRYLSGRWDEAERLAAETIAWGEEGSPHFVDAFAREIRGAIRIARGDPTGAFEDAAKGLEVGRSAKDPQVLWPALAFYARIAFAAGREKEAEAVVDELLERWRKRPRELLPFNWVVDLVWVLRALGRVHDFQSVATHAHATTRWLEAAKALASGDLRGGAEAFAVMGDVADEAYARLRTAEGLAAEGRRAEADEQLRQALTFYRSVGATNYIREGEALLSATA
jgi:class 3 adenylate cyclase/tetratricopeptide (TPR) repeat protein